MRASAATAVEEPGADDVHGAEALTILSITPNPFNPSTEVHFENRSPDRVTMEVYDVSGRRVATVPLGIVEPGRHSARWDGRDTRGLGVASGVYFVRLRGDKGESHTVKAVVIR